MNEIELTLLEEEQLVGSDKCDCLDLFKHTSVERGCTDYCILTGASSIPMRINGQLDYSKKSIPFWTKSGFGGEVVRVCHHQKIETIIVYDDYVSIVPVFKVDPHLLSTLPQVKNNGIIEVQYGEYPSFIVEEELFSKLETALQEGKLSETGKVYTKDPIPRMFCNRIPTLTEFLYGGKKYIRLKMDRDRWGHLSNGVIVQKGIVYWLKVEPIVWQYDAPSGFLISKTGLVSGVPFCDEPTNSIEDAYMYHYLNTYLAKEIIPSQMVEDKSSVFDNNESLKKYVYKNYGKKR